MVKHPSLCGLLSAVLAFSPLAEAKIATPKSKVKKAARAAEAAPAANPAAPHKVVRLSQKDAAELVLKQGAKTKEVNLQYLEYRLGPALALSTYDWKLTVTSGYLYNKTESFSPSIPTGAKYEQYQTDAYLQKPVATTGTILGFEAHRLSQNADILPGTTTSTVPSRQTQDSFGLTLEQPLLADFFGAADRATVNAAETSYQAQDILRANDLQNVVLDTIRLFWDTYVAQENFKEALASRERYQKLLDSVKRKTSLGYSAPGDLSQAQAQFESREQNVKAASVDYLQKMDSLITTLGLEPGTEIEFVITDTLPPLPSLPPVKAEDLRAIRSQKLKLQAAQDSLSASESKRYPTLNFVGKVYTTGAGDTSEASYSAATSGTHPEYYAGLKLLYNFGSDIQTEDIINKRAAKELEESRLARQSLEINDNLAQADRKVQSTYAIAQSSARQKDAFDKAVRELTRTYNQGRTDIKTLIDVMNSYFTSEVQLSRAIGDYQIALNELAASRDELISAAEEKK